MKESTKARFRVAMTVLDNVRKSDYARLVYGENMDGIDYAIPCSVYEKMTQEEYNFSMTDCTTSNYRIVNLLDCIPDYIAERVIEMSALYSAYVNETDENVKSVISESYHAIKNSLDMYVKGV